MRLPQKLVTERAERELREKLCHKLVSLKLVYFHEAKGVAPLSHNRKLSVAAELVRLVLAHDLTAIFLF